MPKIPDIYTEKLEDTQTLKHIDKQTEIQKTDGLSHGPEMK